MSKRKRLVLSGSDDLPLYQQIVQAVSQAIAAGRYVVGDQLPGHLELSQQLGVSPVTVRRAYELMHRQGMVNLRHGQGTFIAQSSVEDESPAAGPQRVFAVIGESDISRCKQPTLFALMGVLGGMVEALGPETKVIHVDSLTSRHMSDVTSRDAVILMDYTPVDQAESGQLLSQGVTMVSSIHGEMDSRIHRVRYDRHLATKLACEHLIGLGYRRIGFLGNRTYQERVTEKYASYTHWLQQAGLDVHARHVRQVPTTPGLAYAAAMDMVRQNQLPPALFVDTDYKAMEVITALQQAGLSVPGDVSVVGYDDIPEAATYEPALTTIRTPRQEIGRTIGRLMIRAVKLAADRLALETQNILLEPELMIRASTAPAIDRTETGGKVVQPSH